MIASAYGLIVGVVGLLLLPVLVLMTDFPLVRERAGPFDELLPGLRFQTGFLVRTVPARTSNALWPPAKLHVDGQGRWLLQPGYQVVRLADLPSHQPHFAVELSADRQLEYQVVIHAIAKLRSAGIEVILAPGSRISSEAGR